MFSGQHTSAACFTLALKWFGVTQPCPLEPYCRINSGLSKLRGKCKYHLFYSYRKSFGSLYMKKKPFFVCFFWHGTRQYLDVSLHKKQKNGRSRPSIHCWMRSEKAVTWWHCCREGLGTPGVFDGDDCCCCNAGIRMMAAEHINLH